ncbi:MAG: hypothetical protein SF162_18950 [bacterium]|nr:hypothetical protein [bacterium]
MLQHKSTVIALLAVFIAAITAVLIFFIDIRDGQSWQAAPVPHQSPAAELVFEQSPGPDVPTLQTLTRGATTDAEAIAQVVAWFNAEENNLRSLWREENDTRLAGLFTMYVVHISHIYGETPYQTSFLDYLTLERSHCGNYSVAQAQIAEALGLEWRLLELSSGWHGWIEIRVDDQWEIFDSTVNVWIDTSSYELFQGAAREYRSFYTPLLDIDRPDARLHLDEGYNMQQLRANMPGFGVYFLPPGEIVLSHRIAEVTAPA